MEKLIFDTGMKSFAVNDGGVLRFNPSDPNVYARFVEAAAKIQAVEDDMVKKAQSIKAEGEEAGEAALKLMKEADQEMKKILGWVFGEINDFEKIFAGVNLMAVGENGERLITNFISALLPIMQTGAQKCANEQIGGAVQTAKLNRAQRRAKK